MQIHRVQNYINNVYTHKNEKKENSNVSFHGITEVISKEPVWNESKKLAEQAISMCKNLAGKQPTINGIRVAPMTEYGADKIANRKGMTLTKAAGFPLTLSKRFSDKDVTMIIQPNSPISTLDAETVTLVINEGKEFPTVIRFDNSSDRMMSKKLFNSMWENSYEWDFLSANEDDAKIFNSFVSKFIEASDKLIESFT